VLRYKSLADAKWRQRPDDARTGFATEMAVMSLSEREQQALTFIGQGLADSDPKLASLLDTFTRLTLHEEMPAGEQIVTGSRSDRRLRRLRRRRRHPRLDRAYALAGHMRHRLSWKQSMLLLWLATALALIVVALVLSRTSGKGSCARSCAVAAAQNLRGTSHGGRVPAAGPH
jgi:hypothetical protein